MLLLFVIEDDQSFISSHIRPGEWTEICPSISMRVQSKRRLKYLIAAIYFLGEDKRPCWLSLLSEINNLYRRPWRILGSCLDEPAIWWKAFSERLANVNRQITDDHVPSNSKWPCQKSREIDYHVPSLWQFVTRSDLRKSTEITHKQNNLTEYKLYCFHWKCKTFKGKWIPAPLMPTCRHCQPTHGRVLRRRAESNKSYLAPICWDNIPQWGTGLLSGPGGYWQHQISYINI